MKKLSLALVLVAASMLVNAQKFKPFKVDLSLGYAIPGGSGAKGGVLFAVEPKFAASDNISIGLRLESALMARASINADGSAGVSEIKGSGSYLATGDYYFSTNDFRPFFGIGMGLFNTASGAVVYDATTDSYMEVSAGSKFGGLSRVGFEYKHFRMAVDYNIAGKTGTSNNNYVGIKLGVCIGGGRIAK